MSSKTIKRGILGGDETKTKSGNDELDRILEGGVNDAYKRPWHRLERGLRLNRLRLFVTEEAARVNLTEVESMQLLALLQKSLDKKILNSKTTVIYDQDEEKIKEIKGLVSHRESDGLLKYRFIEKRTGVTMRRKRSIVGSGGGSGTPE